MLAIEGSFMFLVIEGNSNHSFYYYFRERIKITNLQKINSNNNPLKVDTNSGFERHLGKNYNFDLNKSGSISSIYIKRDIFGRAIEQFELKRCH
jgi:hypothetical protein